MRRLLKCRGMQKRVPDVSESLGNADPSARAAILGKCERVPVTAANDTAAQVEHFDISMPPDTGDPEYSTLEDAAQERQGI